MLCVVAVSVLCLNASSDAGPRRFH